MRHLPISLDVQGKRIVVAGGGEAAAAKLRLLRKTGAEIAVCAATPLPEVERLAGGGLVRRQATDADAAGALLVYAASGDAAEDARVARLAHAAGALCNTVDDGDASDFLTPAIVDRSPVTVAIGTEGAAPMLARMLKADVEALLPTSLGPLTRIAGRFRTFARAVAPGAARRAFWRRFFAEAGPRAYAAGGAEAAAAALETLRAEAAAAHAPEGHVDFIGAGPGDPELMTARARRLLGEADVVIYDRLVSPAVLDLARREARMIFVGKSPGAPSWRQADIDALLVAEAKAGRRVARLKSGDPGVFGRLDEEIAALDAAGIGFAIAPGVTAAMAAAAAAKVSLTRRGRNSDLRLLTGHDVDGFAEHDWRALAKPGATAAIYMGVRAAGFLQGRLLMHGADPATPMGVVENAGAPGQKIVAASLGEFAPTMAAAGIEGPAILFLGLAPRAAVALPTAPLAVSAAGGAR